MFKLQKREFVKVVMPRACVLRYVFSPVGMIEYLTTKT